RLPRSTPFPYTTLFRSLNLYGCRPSPRPDEISLSSSTASTVSGRGYAAAEAAFAQLEAARTGGHVAPVFTRMADEVRSAIHSRLDRKSTRLNSSHQIIS